MSTPVTTPHHYTVLITTPGQPVSLSQTSELTFGNVIVQLLETNTAGAKVYSGALADLLLGVNGPGWRREDTFDLGHPDGVDLSKHAIVGANVGDGVVIYIMGKGRW